MKRWMAEGDLHEKDHHERILSDRAAAADKANGARQRLRASILTPKIKQEKQDENKRRLSTVVRENVRNTIIGQVYLHGGKPLPKSLG